PSIFGWMERLKGYTTLPFHSTLRVLHLQVESAHPEKDGPLIAAEKLALRKDHWKALWDRFCEAPNRYSNIPLQIKKCKMPGTSMMWSMGSATDYAGWPQWNEQQETELRKVLLSLADKDASTCRTELIKLEQRHVQRRSLVWAELQEASLALALEHLTAMSTAVQKPLNAGTLDDVTKAYQDCGFAADASMLSALAAVDSKDDFKAVSAVIRCLYLPWLEDSARHLQNIWETIRVDGNPAVESESCIVFVDGLRFDCARNLLSLLAHKGVAAEEQIRWAALPSVTGTGKPAVAPLAASSAAENPDPTDFQALSSYQFEKALKEAGWLIIRSKDPIPSPIAQGYPVASTINKIWVEIGNLDHEGHERGAKIAKHLPSLLAEVTERIEALLAAGWTRIRVVTDHGWLLMPGGLPKAELPSAISENKWGRCALIKSGATTDHRVFPWFWNPDQSVVLADGISCFRGNEEYAHGGLSLQECLTLDLIISQDAPTGVVTIEDVKWKGLRCSVLAQGAFTGMKLDVRKFAEDSASSLINKSKPVEADGQASVLVIDMDGDLDGTEAFVVLTNDAGVVTTQISTQIGG
ncbi:MAG: BREX-1 system phosphatase PglZ type B, partial [Negativicutes bacterium]|nr:BREX-1 system phosphatase PglZ type B [Negativicutes bacterium]